MRLGLCLVVVFAFVVLINCVNGSLVTLVWAYANTNFSLTLNTCQQLNVTFTVSHTFEQFADPSLLSCNFTSATTLTESGKPIQFNASQTIYAGCSVGTHCLNGGMHIITVNDAIEPGWDVQDGVCVTSSTPTAATTPNTPAPTASTTTPAATTPTPSPATASTTTPTPTPTTTTPSPATTTAPTTNPGATIQWVYGNTVTSLTANTCESFTFQYTTSHTVYNLSSLANFNNCSFAGATEVASSGPLTLQSPIAGTFYFACIVPNHCTNGNMKVAVTVASTVATGWSVINGQCVAAGSSTPTPTSTSTATSTPTPTLTSTSTSTLTPTFIQTITASTPAPTTPASTTSPIIPTPTPPAPTTLAPTSTAAPTNTPSTPTPTSSSTSSTDATPTPSSSTVVAFSSSNAGAIAGGIIGGLVGLALLVLLLWLFRARYWNKKEIKEKRKSVT